jgi:hypothetical protein
LVIEMNPTADPRQSQTERKRGRKNAKEILAGGEDFSD